MDEQKKDLSQKREINWMKVLFQLQVNTFLVFAIGYLIMVGCMWKTIFFGLTLSLLAVLGQFAGAHRLWAHGSYKATPALRVFLMFCQTLVGHGSIYDWVQLHRLHHEHFGTELDPYNPKKGFFYSHMFSLMKDLSPAQLEALKKVDMSDIEKDEVVMFQKKWYGVLFVIFTVLLPANAPCEYWGESLPATFMIMCWLRYAFTLHLCWLIHSATNIWDLKPGEKFPADTNLVFLITKTYWISYHYLTPWDYQTSEYGKYGSDCVSKFIKVCAALDYATDLKTIDSRGVRSALAKSINKNKKIELCLAEYVKTEDSPVNYSNEVASKLCCS